MGRELCMNATSIAELQGTAARRARCVWQADAVLCSFLCTCVLAVCSSLCTCVLCVDLYDSVNAAASSSSLWQLDVVATDFAKSCCTHSDLFETRATHSNAKHGSSCVAIGHLLTSVLQARPLAFATYTASCVYAACLHVHVSFAGVFVFWAVSNGRGARQASSSQLDTFCLMLLVHSSPLFFTQLCRWWCCCWLLSLAGREMQNKLRRKCSWVHFELNISLHEASDLDFREWDVLCNWLHSPAPLSRSIFGRRCSADIYSILCKDINVSPPPLSNNVGYFGSHLKSILWSLMVKTNPLQLRAMTTKNVCG